ncbi:hypothetical protein [Streptomyces sp. NPDC055709]
MKQALQEPALLEPPVIPVFMWYALSAGAIATFYAYYAPLAPNKVERVKIYVAPMAGLFTLWIFTVTMEGISTRILPPALAFTLPAFVLGCVGHRENMRAIWKRQAIEGQEGNAPPPAITLQFLLSLTVFGALGIWFLT